ncbi:13662_t:CDS:2 [Ambispora gerdemannii]|uniref:13662_t:CDS:1 n=1 Tax=Ambispora gerdemannii TaxID=144530 RepID=A0A9N8WIR4_9GLOM|nr:13662_t:CDS:2 [Ambispora gerdemannii]
MSAKKKTKFHHPVSCTQYSFTSLTTSGFPLYGQPAVNSNIIFQPLILNSRQLAEYYTNHYNTTTMDSSIGYLNNYPPPAQFAQISPYVQAIPWRNCVEQTISPSSTHASRPTLSEDPFIVNQEYIPFENDKNQKKRKLSDKESPKFVNPQTIPWVSGWILDDFTKAIYILNQEMQDFVDYISPRHEERRMRQYVIRLIEREFGGDKIAILAFGSFDTELYLPTSDIDLVFFCKSTDIRKLVHSYAAKIRRLNGLNEPANGGMGSYTVLLLVISFLQHHKLSRTNRINARQNLGVLLIDFFELYGNKFNYQDLAICVKSDGDYLHKAETLIPTNKPDMLAIIDPCNNTNNVANATSNWKLIRDEFAEAARKLRKAVIKVQDGYFLKRSNEPANFSILGSIVSVSNGWQKERNHIMNIYNDIKAGRINSFSPLERGNELDYVFSDEHLRVKVANIENVYEGYIQAVVAQRNMASLEAKPKSILKKPSITFQSKAPRLKWDEDNLQLTESQKDSTMKISEPKTPFIHYNQETDEIMTDLDTIPGLALNTSGISPVGSVSSVSSSGAHFPDTIKDDWESENSEEDEETREKRKKFAQLRARHYNMKEAIRLGHKLVDEEIDDEDNNNQNNGKNRSKKEGKKSVAFSLIGETSTHTYEKDVVGEEEVKEEDKDEKNKEENGLILMET